MEKSRTFKELLVWQKAHRWVLDIYKYTDAFPRSEMFGLSSQLRRAAVSIPANIAEGYKKSGKQDKVRFMNIAQASLEECRYYLILAQDLNYGNSEELNLKLEEVSRMLNAYSKAILTPDS